MAKDILQFPSLSAKPSAPSAGAGGPGLPRRPTTRLPPLNLFRTFDAAARHNSFRLAADELCVTPSAVSQQIRQLEEFLETRLFRRLTRRIELTREGAALAGTVQEAMAMLSAGCDRLRQPLAPTVVCINVVPVLALRWLVSRLKQFSDDHGHIKISLLASADPLDFERQDVDVGIRWGSGHFPGMRAEPLANEIVFPVCSPDYLPRIETPDDLRHFPLLQSYNGVPWSTWFEAAGTGFPSTELLYFNDIGLMLEAVSCGQGIGLASSLLVENDLRSGRLVRLFDFEVQVNEGFYVLSSETLGDKPTIVLIREWLQSEARRSVAFVGGLCSVPSVKGVPAASDR